MKYINKDVPLNNKTPNARRFAALVLLLGGLSLACPGCSREYPLKQTEEPNTEAIIPNEHNDEAQSEMISAEDLFKESLEQQILNGELKIGKEANPYVSEISINNNFISITLSNGEKVEGNIDVTNLRIENIVLSGLTIEIPEGVTSDYIFSGVKVTSNFHMNGTTYNLKELERGWTIDLSNCKEVIFDNSSIFTDSPYVHIGQKYGLEGVKKLELQNTSILGFGDENDGSITLAIEFPVESFTLTGENPKVSDVVFEDPYSLKETTFGEGTSIECPKGLEEADELTSYSTGNGDEGKNIIGDLSPLYHKKLETFNISQYPHCSAEDVYNVIATNPMKSVTGEGFAVTNELIRYCEDNDISFPDSWEELAERNNIIRKELEDSIGDSTDFSKVSSKVISYYLTNHAEWRSLGFNVDDNFINNIIKMFVLAGIEAYQIEDQCLLLKQGGEVTVVDFGELADKYSQKAISSFEEHEDGKTTLGEYEEENRGSIIQNVLGEQGGYKSFREYCINKTEQLLNTMIPEITKEAVIYLDKDEKRDEKRDEENSNKDSDYLR